MIKSECGEKTKSARQNYFVLSAARSVSQSVTRANCGVWMDETERQRPGETSAPPRDTVRFAHLFKCWSRGLSAKKPLSISFEWQAGSRQRRSVCERRTRAESAPRNSMINEPATVVSSSSSRCTAIQLRAAADDDAPSAESSPIRLPPGAFLVRNEPRVE